MSLRKIVHIDMDAFYASVEQRDDPQLRAKPVMPPGRVSVLSSVGSRMKFGFSAYVPRLAPRALCPHAVFVPPEFSRYRAVSRLVRLE